MFQAYKNMVKVKFDKEYEIAESKKNLGKYFLKISFDFSF